MKNLFNLLFSSFLLTLPLISEELNNNTYSLEIESLLMVMNYQEINNIYKDTENIKKYQALPLDKCNCLVKVKNNSGIQLFNVDICTKTLVKK
tara:strand:- start:3 stop:281 length:279 start_codon:yes stop_codon:yes gene_type:complete